MRIRFFEASLNEAHRESPFMSVTLPDILFYLLAALTGLSAVAVVVTQNIVRAATYLLFALAGTAGIFFLLGADFLGATQLLIYVGGTLVLVVFGVMLTAQGPFINMKIGAAEWAIGLAVGLLFYGVLAVVLSAVEAPESTVVGTRYDDPSAGKSLAASKHLGGALLGDIYVSSDAFMTGTPDARKHERRKVAYLL